jgi:hypothetical protein
MPSPEKSLVWFLRLSAVMFLAATPFVFVPTAWMDAIAQSYGLASLPDLPLMGYLTRHLSALYACMGASYWYISTDLRRFMPLVRFTVPLTFLQALVIVGIDIAVAMPLSWIVGEAISMFVWTLILWWLVRRCGSTISHNHTSAPATSARA